jgi:hypothetical protein
MNDASPPSGAAPPDGPVLASSPAQDDGPGDAGRPSRRPTSVVLAEIAAGLEGDTIALADLAARLGDRAFGMVILLPAMVNLIPNVPGLTTMFGLLMFVPSLQMALGRRQLWLPRRLAARRLSVPRVQKVVAASLPHVRRFERYLRPRMTWLCRPPFEPLVGLAMALLCLLVALPIPFSNFIPGVAVLVIALGLVEQDGAFIVGGITLGVAAALIVALFLATALKAASLLALW